MEYVVEIPYCSTCYIYYLLKNSDYQRIELKNVVIFDVSKHHNHRYDLQGFFYDAKVIVGPYSFRSKKELHGAIQKLLQKYLNVDVQ